MSSVINFTAVDPYGGTYSGCGQCNLKMVAFQTIMIKILRFWDRKMLLDAHERCIVTKSKDKSE